MILGVLVLHPKVMGESVVSALSERQQRVRKSTHEVGHLWTLGLLSMFPVLSLRPTVSIYAARYGLYSHP